MQLPERPTSGTKEAINRQQQQQQQQQQKSRNMTTKVDIY